MTEKIVFEYSNCSQGDLVMDLAGALMNLKPDVVWFEKAVVIDIADPMIARLFAQVLTEQSRKFFVISEPRPALPTDIEDLDLAPHWTRTEEGVLEDRLLQTIRNSWVTPTSEPEAQEAEPALDPAAFLTEWPAEPAAAAPAAPEVPALVADQPGKGKREFSKVCEYCGDTFLAWRKDQTHRKPECQKKHAKAKRDLAQKLLDQPKRTSPEDLPEAGPDLGPAVYEVLTGTRAGQRLSSTEMATALKLHTLELGSHVRHDKRGEYKIIEHQSKPGHLTFVHLTGMTGASHA
jgi:hypothetical protein